MLKTQQRYLALDVLRGLTIALMILVNTPGSWATIYAPFKHSAWHGFTITDLVFPTFLFVVGNAMSFSLRKYEGKEESLFLKKIFKRSILIFLIGLFLNAFPFLYRNEAGDLAFNNLANIRIMGVLQRIALCYLIASLLIHYLKLKVAVVASILILFGYWLVMYIFGDQPDPYTLTGNAALKFDLMLFRPENLYRGFGLAFDPEGLLSSFPAVVNVVAGYLAGIFIQKSGNTFSTVWKLVLAGIIAIILAQIWNPFFPINKAIWTSSYVLLSVGWALIIIALLILIIELWKLKGWTYFFEVFGKNPLFIYVLSGLGVGIMDIILVNSEGLQTWIYKNGFLSWLTDYNASLVFAICYVLLMWIVGYIMDKRKIYIKV
ncbi:MAG TPA: heparan-alpha-glucosaminide N-acetyltransferase domain-containing protein [Gillisia sp.]|nr:heparan-alpha-glucosaminide N-acetyltransferase domain-containing protein [Gillisia sp.]